MKAVRKKPVKKKRSQTFWHAVTLFISLASLSLAAWVSYSPFLETPRDVSRTRTLFLSAKNSFLHNPTYWHAKRRQMEGTILKELQDEGRVSASSLMRGITPEMLMSYAVDVLGVPVSLFDSISLYPKISGSSFLILISKKENSLWPLSVIVSLEVEVVVEPKGATLVFRRLRRGTEELAVSQASMYFGADLERKFHIYNGCVVQ